jgi:hypothetical protein
MAAEGMQQAIQIVVPKVEDVAWRSKNLRQ